MTSLERARVDLLPRGFTLVEVMVASALSVAVLLGLWNVWSQAARQTARLSGGNEQMQELRLGCKRVMNELQEGLALYYPQPGGQTQSGLSFLNAQGAVVAYHEALSEDGASRSIRRYDFTADTDEEVVKGVAWFRATALPAARGLEPSCVTLEVCLTGAAPDGATTASHSMASTVFLRGLQRDLPE